jgi:hypothetical protein
VLAAGLAGRRGEAVRQDLPAGLGDGGAPPHAAARPPGSDAAWGWVRDPESGGLLLVAEPASREPFAGPASPDVLAYWSLQPGPAIRDWVFRDTPRGEADAQRLRDALAAAPLPDDARLLGAWDAGPPARLVLPGPIDVAEAAGGVIVWYSLGWSRVVEAEAAPAGEWVPR